MRSRHPFWRKEKIGDEPCRVIGRHRREFLNNRRDFNLFVAIEEKVRDYEIVSRNGSGPCPDILVQKLNLRQSDRRFLSKPFLRQLQHSRTRVNTIDLDLRMHPKKFAKKTAVPLAHNQRSAWLGKFLEPIDARTLQRRTKGKRFQPIVMVRDAVEVHKSTCPRSKASGVNITRSASATRSSVNNGRK